MHPVGALVTGLAAGLLVYGALRALTGLRLTQEQEFEGADLSLHHIEAEPSFDRNFPGG